MIIGNGLIASCIASLNREDVVFFASGVSNSVNPTNTDFKREQDLLKETIKLYPKQLLVYFSTVSIEDRSVQHKPYIKHKLKMEKMVSKNAEKYLILRLPNMLSLTGNPNTLIPNFYKAITENKKVVIQKNATRYLLAPEQLKNMTSLVLEQNVLKKKTTQRLILQRPIGRHFICRKIRRLNTNLAYPMPILFRFFCLKKMEIIK